MTTPDTTATLCGECATVALCLLDGCASRLPDAVMAELDVAALRAELDNARRDLTEVEAGWQQADSARQRLLVDRSNLRADVQLRDRQLDEAHATIERQRAECADAAGQLAEVNEKLARTEELWMRDSEVAETGIEDTIRHHHQINALEQQLADAVKIAEVATADAVQAQQFKQRLTYERDQARAERDIAAVTIRRQASERHAALATVERVAAHRDRLAAALTTCESERALMEATAAKLGDDVDELQSTVKRIQAERDQMRAERDAAISTAERLAAERDEATRTLAELAPAREPDTALTDLRATVKRLTAERDQARRESERFIAVQRLSQQLTRELEQARAARDIAEVTIRRQASERDAAVAAVTRMRASYAEIEEHREQLLGQLEESRDKAARWRKRAKKRKEKLSYARLLAITQAEQLARMSPVVEAALEWRGEGLPVPDYALVDEEIALRDAVTAYQAATVVGAKPADTLPAEQVSPVTQNAETEPRVWQVGDPEPGPEVTAVEDEAGDIWTRVGPEWQYDAGRTLAARWRALAAEYGPLTDATPREASRD